ncbi:15913_t:CDS:2, partial [Dentiscutata heterogama]
MSQTILKNIVEEISKLLDEESMKGTRPKTIYDMMNKIIIMKQQKPNNFIWLLLIVPTLNHKI